MEDNRKSTLGNPSVIFGILAGAAALYAGSTLLNLSALQRELQIDQNVTLDPSSTPLAAKLRIAITLKNPTNGTITVKRPVTTIFFNSSEIATSDTISDKDYVLPKFGQVTLEPYLVSISLLSAGTAAVEFLKNLGSSREITLRARSLTMINGSVPFSKETLVPILKAKR